VIDADDDGDVDIPTSKNTGKRSVEDNIQLEEEPKKEKKVFKDEIIKAQ
jgi:hypothetical protein